MDWTQQIAANNPGITPSELRDAMNFHTRSPGRANALGTVESLVVAQEGVQQSGFGGGGGADTSGSGQYPESFRCIYDPVSKTYNILNPIVCTSSGQINATGAENLSAGSYYCKVSNENGTFSAEITDSSDTDENTVVVVPIADITANDGIHQKHIGTIILSGGGSAVSTKAAFDLEVTKSSTGSKTGKIVRCNFMFDGENKSLPDFSVSGSGSVYLVAKQPAPSGGMGDLPWTFEISESEGEATEGGRVVNYKLYDLNDFAVTCDYRTTFMELKSPHHVSKFTVSKYAEPQSSVVIEACQDAEAKVTVSDGTASATLKASNETAETEVSNGAISAKMGADGTTAKLTLTGTKTVIVDPDDLKEGSEARFHKLTVKHADGSADDVYDVIADKDITINESAGDERLTGVDLELNGEANLRLKLTFTDKDGNTRDAYSTGLTLKQVDVVSDVNWSSPTLSKSGKKVTVIEEKSTGDQNVFTAVAHSSNS